MRTVKRAKSPNDNTIARDLPADDRLSGPKPQAMDRRLAATVVRNLPQGSAAFDAMGRRVLQLKPGIYFQRTTATAAPRKVLLVE